MKSTATSFFSKFSGIKSVYRHVVKSQLIYQYLLYFKIAWLASDTPYVLCNVLLFFLFFYLYGINSGPEHWIVVLHRPPVLWPVGICQIAAILFQDV